jgi:endonuclease/exonuclease/phosphatase family metal-dependent hydrolase
MATTTPTTRHFLTFGSIACWSMLAAADRCPGADCPVATAKIAAWNIKGIPPITDARVPAIARGISILNADLIALLEVRPNNKIGPIIRHLRRCGRDYDYYLPPCNSEFGMAILHKRHVAVAGVHLIPGSSACNRQRARKAVAANVKIGQFDFIFVVIHPQAGPTPTARALRTRQAAAVARYIKLAIQGDEKDVLVVGDYNMVPPKARRQRDAVNFAALNPANTLRILSNEKLTEPASYVLLGRPLLMLDGYAISRCHTQEYVERSLRIVRMDRLMKMRPPKYSRQVSDHFPLMAKFDISTDDD